MFIFAGGGEPLLNNNLFDYIDAIGDCGFSSWVTTNGRLLDDGPAKSIYVINEQYAVAQDLRVYLDMCQAIDRLREGWPLRCDDARPDIIDYLTRHNINAVPAGKGRVEDEIDVLRQFEIYVHPRCENSAREIVGWSYKTDRNGEVIPVPDKNHDHCPDAMRYAVVKAARSGTGGYEIFSDEW